MIGVDLFSGAGGMSLGAQWAGVQVKVAVEANRHAAATFASNHPEVVMIPRPIQKIRSIEIQRGRSELVVFGGPPCQGFSTSNQRTRSSENPLNWLFREYVRIIRHLRPEWIVFENVPGMVITEGGRFLRAVLLAFQKLGYRTEHFVLNAAKFGVPQNRSRLFIVGSLGNVKLSVPTGVDDVVTVRDAIADLPVLRNGASVSELPYRCPSRSSYARLLRGRLRRCSNHLVSRNAEHIVRRYMHVPQGGNWEDIPEDQMDSYSDRTRCHTGIYRRLVYDEPAIVIGNFRKNMLIHPTQDRGLSVREAARLQSFPDDFVFTGSIGFQQQQVGNAVPPKLAHAVFATLRPARTGVA
jgi:DNA (cytosine-5)-methyltransferase 1